MCEVVKTLQCLDAENPMKRSALKWLGRCLARAALAATVVPMAARAAEPVRLKVAYGQAYAVSGMTFDWTTIDVKVKNIAFQ